MRYAGKISFPITLRLLAKSIIKHITGAADPRFPDALRVCCPEAGQYWTPKPVCSPPVQLGEKLRHGGTKRISFEQLRKALGLESVKDAAGNIIQEAPLTVWANLRQRALDTAIAEINKKTDLKIALESLGRSKHRRVTTLTFAIKAQAIPNGDSKGSKS